MGFAIGASILEVLISLLMFNMGMIKIATAEYFTRYLIVPTIIYWVLIGLGLWGPKLREKYEGKPNDNFFLNCCSLYTMEAVLFEIGWIHHAYAATLATLVVPILFSFVFADKNVTKRITVIATIAIVLCTIHRRVDLAHRNLSDPYQYGNGIIVVIMTVAMGALISSLAERQRQTLESLESTVKEVEIANEAKTAFLANMSHEIRTPINAIIGINEMIRRENVNDQINDYSHDIHGAADSLLNTVNSILDLTKIESGKMELSYVDYDILNLVHDVASIVNIRAKEKGIELKVDVDKGIPSKYHGDDVHIKQIITNLLTNAVKYTDEGSVLLKVFGHREGENEVLEVLVKDTGIGIRFEDRAKLFSKFERIDLARNRNVEGTGLGLTITAQLLRMMDSMLEVDSEYGKGSTFFFKIKQKIVDETPVGEASVDHHDAKQQQKYKPKFVAPKAKVLVTDDNAMNIKVFMHLLKSTKMNVDKADSGKAAIEKTLQNKYDIIFMDHMMPEMDGIETMHNIRSNPDNINKDTKIVALTANAIVGAKEMYLSEGFDAFLSKPIDPVSLEKLALSFLPEEYIEG
ncbi:MAG: response regulator [Lachnospiraceae bacterium]|nr:response regulator [Lachnospiraceae bacterium]